MVRAALLVGAFLACVQSAVAVEVRHVPHVKLPVVARDAAAAPFPIVRRQNSTTPVVTTPAGASATPVPTTPFLISVVVPGTKKRQAASYLTANGLVTANAAFAASWSIVNGALYSGAGQVSALAGAVLSPFDSTVAVGPITTTFSYAASLTWTNAAFGNNPALYCRLATGQVQAVLSGAIPANCAAVSLVPLVPTTPTTTAPGTAITAPPGTVLPVGTINIGVTVNVALSLFFNPACGCVQTGSATSTVPVATVTGVVYNAACGCSLPTTYVTPIGPTPTPVTSTVTYYNSACGCTTTTAFVVNPTGAPKTNGTIIVTPIPSRPATAGAGRAVAGSAAIGAVAFAAALLL